MSVEVMAMVFRRYPVGGGEMLLALALADHSDDEGRSIFPSIKRLAQKTRQSERTVQYQLRALERMGWLICVSLGGEGARDTREWHINSDWIAGEEIAGFDVRIPVEKPIKGAKVAPLISDDESKIRVQLATIRVQPDANKGAIAVAPEPSRIIIQPSDTNSAITQPEKPPNEIVWDSVNKIFIGIDEILMSRWEAAFPKLDIDALLTQIELWYERKLRESLASGKRTKPKHPWRSIERGIAGWLAREAKDLARPKVFAKPGQVMQR